MSKGNSVTVVFGFDADKETVLEEMQEEKDAGFEVDETIWDELTFYTCEVGVIYRDGSYEIKCEFDNSDMSDRGKTGYSWKAAERCAIKWGSKLGCEVVSDLYISDAKNKVKLRIK